MPLGILDQRRRVIEPERLVVEQRRVERRRVVRLQVRAGIHDQREARGVRLGEAIERERRDRPEDALGRLARDAALGHARSQSSLDLSHARFGSLEPHRPAQFLGLAARESRHDHRHAQQLLLEQRHAERALQDRLERRMGVHDRFVAAAPRQVRMHHLADDRPRPDDRDLHHEVVEAGRLEAGQRRHLRPRLHLEQPDGVGLLQHLIDDRIVRRQVREIDRRRWRGLGVVSAGACFVGRRRVDDGDRLLQHGQHAEPEQVHLDDAHVGAVFLVPLHHHASRHARRLQRHHIVEPPLAQDHAAGVLAEMPRDVLHLHPQIAELLDLRQVGIDAQFPQVAGQRVLRVLPLEGTHHLRERVDHLGRAPEHLAHLARRTAATIGDDVGRHRRTALAIPRVEILDGLFASIATREIEIDVRPLAALLGQEALEQQLHADGIDGRDAQAVAHRAVGGRPSPLREDVLLPTEVDEVPHDEEVAGEIELLDQIEFTRDLPPRLLRQRPVPPVRARLGDAAEERDLRFPLGHRVVGKAIAEIRQREIQTFGQHLGVGHRLRQIAEERLHLPGRLQVALGIGREPTPGMRERRAMPDAREHVVERPRLGRCEAHAIGREDRHAIRLGRRHQDAVVHFLVTREMPLDLHVHLGPAEHADDLIEQPGHAMAIGRQHRPPDDGDEAVDVPIEIAHGQRALPLGRGQLHPGDEPAQRAIALRRGHEQRQAPDERRMQRRRGRRPCATARLHRHFGPDERAEAGLAGRLVEPRRAVDAVAVEQRQGVVAERARLLDERLGQRRTVEEGESR